MHRIIRTGFKKITHSIDFNPQTLEKGKLLAINHVRQVEVIFLESKRKIKCLVISQTSVNLKPYNVELEIDHQHVTQASCTCLAHSYKYSGKCKHICAVITFINSEESRPKTSEEQAWSKPSANKQLGKSIYSKGIQNKELSGEDLKFANEDVPVYEFQALDLENNCPQKICLTEESRKESEEICKNIVDVCRKKVVRKVGNEQLEGCLMNMLSMSQNIVIYGGNVNFISADTERFYYENVLLNENEITALCTKTVTQANSVEWHAARKLRITASTKAHSIKIRQRKDVNQLAKEFVNVKTFTSPATEYGNRNESVALTEYKKINEVDVINVGFFVSSVQPWLGVSLDGIVIEDDCITRIVEIKCPFSCKNKPIIDLVNGTCNVSYLRIQNDVVELNESHQYYTQCQMQLYVTGLTVCDLFVWSQVSSVTVEIHRNEQFLSHLLPKLQNFYFQHYIKALLTECEEDIEM